MEEFGEFFTCLGYEPLNIVGIVGYRTRLKHHVFTASDDPKQYSIELHTESSHMHRFPTKVCRFYHRLPSLQRYCSKTYIFHSVMWILATVSNVSEEKIWGHLFSFIPGGGGGYLSQVLLGMCRWPLRTPTPL